MQSLSSNITQTQERKKHKNKEPHNCIDWKNSIAGRRKKQSLLTNITQTHKETTP